MRVNSDFTSLRAGRWMAKSGIGIVLVAIFFIASSFAKDSNRDLRTKEVNLIIREIGHRLLLQAGDSTSRVLPVTEINAGTFLLEFENEFVFNHDSLITLTRDLLPKAKFPAGYTVTVHERATHSIVYGFQVNNNSRDNLACTGRDQPSGHYTIEISFADFYKSAEQKKRDIDQAANEHESLYVDPREINLHLEKLKSIDVDDTEAKKPALDYPSVTLICSGVMVLLSIALLIGRFRKSSPSASVQNQNQAVVDESTPEMAALGKFLFDAKSKRLLLGTEVTSLTDKECQILELLYKNFGELIPRETLMQKVWLDEGVITGRSLDMFVSKLRKKLSADPEIRITNVHGKGYKLEIPGT